MSKDLMTVAETARRLGVHSATLRGWVRQGKVPSYRVGQRFVRLDWAEVLDALATHEPADAVGPEAGDAL